MNISESTNIYGNITVLDGDADTSVLNVTANLQDNNNFNISVSTLRPDLLSTNSTDINTQLNSFFDQVKTKMVTLGYVVTIR